MVPARQLVPAQQPCGQEVRSQTQAPATQRCPAPHGGPDPHWQVPVVVQRSELLTAQAKHVPPFTPQVVIEAGRQTPAAQQPAGQDRASQTQLPLAQRWPATHAAPEPHAQLPPGVQVSASAGSQEIHAAPGAPQRVSCRETQVAPSQQPVGQEVALQTHLPALHLWPAPQAGAVPQTQAPVAEQPSAWVASQPTQTVPPLPHAASERGLQVAPEQQPFGQLVELQPLQCPPVQVWPAGHAWQAPPPPPHDAAVTSTRQAPCAQQPVGHEVPSQTQVLAMQRWPGEQAVPLPQRQPPDDEQLSDRASQATQVEPALPQVMVERIEQVTPLQQPAGHEVASQMHAPPTQRWPPAQAAPAPQPQAPVAPQLSALVASHAAQATPFVPQVASVVGLQAFPAQQPTGQEVASQTHAPPTQRWPA